MMIGAEAKGVLPESPWLNWLKPTSRAKLKMICFPYAGGGASVYRTWPAALSKCVEVGAIQLPGRETRVKEAPVKHLPGLIPPIVDALLPHLSSSFVFFGHSMGALIAFETSRYLRREYGLGPLHLFVSGRGAPQLRGGGEPIHNLPDPSFIEKLRSFNGMPQDVLEDAELMRLALPALRADFSVCETYEYAPESSFSFPISAYGGLQDRDVPPERLQAWGEHTTSKFTVRTFPGDHFYLRRSQPELLRTLYSEIYDLIP